MTGQRRSDRLKRGILRTIAGALTLCALAAVVGLVSGDFDETDARIIGSTASVAGYAILALPAGLLLDRARGRVLAIAAFVIAGAGLGLCLAAIWGADTEPVGKSLAAVTAVGVATANACALALVRPSALRGWVPTLRVASVGLGAAAALMVIVAVTVEIDSDGYYRGLGAVVVLALLFALLVPVAVRLGGLDREHARYTIRLALEPGGDVEREIEAEDLAAAVAAAIRDAERAGARVRRIDPV